MLTRDLHRASSGARRLSDYVAWAEWRHRDLFNEFYRPLGLTWELSVQLGWGPAGTSCCLSLHRAGRDFSERDREMLGLIAPHLSAARARIAAEERASGRLELLERGVEAGGRGVVVLDGSRRLIAAGERGRELIERWFDGIGPELPEALAGWWRLACEGRGPAETAIERGGWRLSARRVPAAGEQLLVLTEEGGEPPLSQRLAEALPITRREAEVLAHLAAGARNAEIAAELGISEHTALRHVEHLYAKLGVHSRVAAARAALEALRGSG